MGLWMLQLIMQGRDGAETCEGKTYQDKLRALGAVESRGMAAAGLRASTTALPFHLRTLTEGSARPGSTSHSERNHGVCC